MRKEFFNNGETGYFKTQQREPVVKNPMTGIVLNYAILFSFIMQYIMTLFNYQINNYMIYLFSHLIIWLYYQINNYAVLLSNQ